jgi:hypothetical protein
MNHGNLNPDLAGFWQSFIAFAQLPTAAQPGQGALHYPPSRQNLKAVSVRCPVEHQQPTTDVIGPVNQFSSVGSVSPDQLESGQVPQELGKHQLGAIPILNTGGMNHHSQEHSQSFDSDMTLASGELLASILALRGPFSGDFHRLAVDHSGTGSGFLPHCFPHFRMQGFVGPFPSPILLPLAEIPPDGALRGQVVGRHAPGQPLRRADKMLLITPCRSALRWRPPGLADGRSSASSSRWASVSVLFMAGPRPARQEGSSAII